jgi:hypothetical protein
VLLESHPEFVDSALAVFAPPTALVSPGFGRYSESLNGCKEKCKEKHKEKNAVESHDAVDSFPNDFLIDRLIKHLIFQFFIYFIKIINIIYIL